MASYIDIPAATKVMSGVGFVMAKDLSAGDSVLTHKCTFAEVERAEIREGECETVQVKAFVSGGFDIALPHTPYLTFNRQMKTAFFAFAKNLSVGNPLLSCRPYVDFVNTRYSMDMEDFVTGFGGLKSVTFNSCRYTIRQVGDVFNAESSKILVVRLRLRDASSVQTENGIIKSWGS